MLWFYSLSASGSILINLMAPYEVETNSKTLFTWIQALDCPRSFGNLPKAITERLKADLLAHAFSQSIIASVNIGQKLTPYLTLSLDPSLPFLHWSVTSCQSLSAVLMFVCLSGFLSRFISFLSACLSMSHR